MRRFGMLAVMALVTLASCGDDAPAFETSLIVADAEPGDVIALRPAGDDVEFVNRRAGEILLYRTGGDTEMIAKIDVGTEGEQRGLLGHTVIDGRRYAAWTDPDTLDLVVGEVTSGSVDRIVWSGTGTQSKAIGGHLETRDGLIVSGIGSLTDWAKDHGSGAIVTLDPEGEPDQEPKIISDGWNNPFAFTVLADGTIWVADNAPDGSDLPVEQRDGERIATATDAGNASGGLVEPPPQRAPSAITQLPDGRLGVCGFLDNEMRAYEITGDNDDALERSGTIGPCLSGTTVLADGTIITSSIDDDGAPVLLARIP